MDIRQCEKHSGGGGVHRRAEPKVVYNQADETLTYNNYSGTPVNWDYKLFIPVKFGYKWKTFTLTFEVDVKKNSGTPAQR